MPSAEPRPPRPQCQQRAAVGSLRSVASCAGRGAVPACVAVVLASGLSSLLALAPSHLPLLTLPLSNPPRLLFVWKGSDSKMEQNSRNKQNSGPLTPYPCLAAPPGSPGPLCSPAPAASHRHQQWDGERRKQVVRSHLRGTALKHPLKPTPQGMKGAF